MTSAYNILDAAGFFTLFEANALDLLTVDNQKVVITAEVIEEIRRRGGGVWQARFDAWRDANPGKYFEIAESVRGMSDADKRRFNPVGRDASIAEGRLRVAVTVAITPKLTP
jgi:hypothetical protein